MKNLKKHFVISLVMCVMLIALSMTSVRAAAGSLLLQGGNTTVTPTPTPTPSSTATPTPSPSATVRITSTPTPVPTSGTDLPKTGENDIYIVSAVGLVVLVIGGVAYIKSRRYSM